MRLPASQLTKYKNILHIAQASIVVLCLILTIAVFASSGKSDGRTGWFFGLCWLTIPILIYLTMVPAWSRARRFSNIYAFAVLDGLSVVLWLSSWAAVASYVVSGKGAGDKKDASGCDNFKYGSKAKCTISEATIIFGVVEMLLFIATALMSFKVVMEFKRTGILPDTNLQGMTVGTFGNMKPASNAQGTTTTVTHGDEEAFDSNMNLRQDWEVDEYEHDEYHERYGGQDHAYAGHDARQAGGSRGDYGYAPADMDDHDVDEYERISPRPHDGRESNAPSLYADRDEQDLTSHRPASTGPGPLGSDTTYHSPTYGQSSSNMYG